MRVCPALMSVVLLVSLSLAVTPALAQDKLSEKDVRKLMEEAEEKLAEGNPAEAQQAYQQIVKDYPDRGDVQLKLARIFRDSEDWLSAGTAFGKAAENLTGVARLLRGYAAAGLENVALWHERDISHSSVERVALPDASILLDYALHRMTQLVENLVVDAEQMAANLEATRGLVYSQAVLLALIDEQDLSRDEAYTIVQRNGMQAWDEGRRLQDLLAADDAVTLAPEVLDACFSAERHLRHAGAVFARLEATAI